MTTHLTTWADSRLTRRWIGDLGPTTRNPFKFREPVGIPTGSDSKNTRHAQGLFSFSKLSPNFSVITHIYYSMARFHMLFANIYHYAGRSDSFGIINLPAKKVGLVNSRRSLFSCTSAGCPEHTVHTVHTCAHFSGLVHTFGGSVHTTLGVVHIRC